MSRSTSTAEFLQASSTEENPSGVTLLPAGAALVVGPTGKVIMHRRPFPIEHLETAPLRGRGLEEIEPTALGETLHRLWRAFCQDGSFHVSEVALGLKSQGPVVHYSLSLGATAHPELPDLCLITVRDVKRHSSEVQDLLASIQTLRDRCDRWEVVTRTAAHDLRSSLSALNGFLKLTLRDPGAPSTAIEKNIGQALQIGTRLIGMLRDFERTEDPYAIDGEQVTIAALGQGLFQTLQAAYPDAAFTWQVECTDLVVRLPMTPTWSALWNVLTNAVKFRREDRPLHIGLRAWVADGSVQMEVRDSGRGIPGGEEEAIFAWGNRGRGTDQAKGSGFGLYSARQQLASRGGRIWVEPCSDGALVRVALPTEDP